LQQSYCYYFAAFFSKASQLCDVDREWILIFTRREAIASAEYWIHFIARFDGVHAIGYNSAGSEPIWMKFEAL